MRSEGSALLPVLRSQHQARILARPDLYRAADRAQERLGLPVNPLVRTPGQWHAAADPLVRQVKASPWVGLGRPGAGDAAASDSTADDS